MITRRALVQTGLAAGLMPTLGFKAAYAATPDDRRLVVIILRGAMDGLSVIVPYGDRAYAPARGKLALEIGKDATKLNDMFGLHNALAGFGGGYTAGEALAVHAVASPARGRSHFDSQNVLETGGLAPYQYSTGWLNRALSALPRAQAVAVTTGMPALLQGPAKVGSWSPSRLPEPNSDLADRISQMYESDPALHAAFTEAQALNSLAKEAGEDKMAMGGGGGKPLTALGGVAAKLMAAPGGPQFVVMERTGWDTHANQLGVLNNSLSDLDGTLAAFKSGLGPLWAKTAILCITEFGRTVAVNGTNGTDHGTGTCALLYGGAVKGGRVLADWPGLAQANLFEGRDLKPTNDVRAVIKGVLMDHIGIDPARLGSSVFPQSAAVAPMQGLIRT